MWEYVVAGIILFIIGAIGLLVWLRKVQFDAVHRNFLDLEDHFGGKVIRAGFAVRPQYTGHYKKNKITISVSSEGNKGGRRYYIAVTMQSHSPVHFTILSRHWLEDRHAQSRKQNVVQLMDGQYLLEVPQVGLLKKINVSALNRIVQQMHPFAYVLIAKTGIILERLSTNLIKDTEFPALKELIQGMYQLKLAVEKIS